MEGRTGMGTGIWRIPVANCTKAILINLRKSSNPLKSLGAGEGNRTLVVSLEGFCSTIELHPPCAATFDPATPLLETAPVVGTSNPQIGQVLTAACGEQSSHIKLVERVGFEPT